MAGPASIDEVIKQLALGAGGQRVMAAMYGNTNTSDAGALNSWWAYDGLNGSNQFGSSAVTYTAPTDPGILPYTAPAAGKALYIARFATFTGLSGGEMRLMDRLAAKYGIVGNVATSQTVSMSLPARITSADGVRCFLEINNVWGSTPTTGTVTYTNQAGVSGRTGTIRVFATMRQRHFEPMSLQQGDTGVQSVQSFQLGVSTGALGQAALVLAKPVASIGVYTTARTGQGDNSRTKGPFETGLAVLPDGAVLFPTMRNARSDATHWTMSLSLIEADA